MDPKLIKTILPIIESVRLYHRHEVIGIENIPKQGGALLVTNHSLATYDILLLGVAIYHEHDRIVRGLIDRLFFKVPKLGEIMEQLGARKGTPENALELLKQGEIICVAPGGMLEALRPSSERYKINW